MKKFDQIPEGLKELFDRKSEKIELSIGQVFCGFDSIPEGILRIRKGELRLIYKDKNKEIFTIEKFTNEDIVGLEQILCGTLGTSLRSSSNVEADYLAKKYFLNFLKNSHNLNNFFADITKYEYLKILLKLEDQLKINNTDLINNLENFYKNKKIKVNLLKPGKHIFKNDSKVFFISSNNIKDHSDGDIISNKENIEVIGNLPARLINLQEISLLSKKKQSSFPSFYSDSVSEKIKSNLNEKREALADMFGSINSQDSFPTFKGIGSSQSTLACLRMLSRFFDLPFKKDIFKRIIEDQNNSSDDLQINLSKLAALINFLGLRTIPLKPNSKSLIKRIPLPAVFIFENKPLILWEYKNNQFYIGDPSQKSYWMKFDQLENIINKNDLKFLFLEKTPSSPKNRFGFSWFLPSIKKHKIILLQVVLASFFVQLLALFNPLLIQQIIDAVINQGNISSLNVLGTLLISMALAQALLSSLRTYLFSDTTNRIDLSLGGKIIHHLLRLPASYFSKRTVGETSSRISELEKIREFLTGTALTLVLDVVFSVIYIAVMMIYSIKLTFVALAVIPFFVLLTVSVSPIIRRQIRNRNIANANLQSHMVETISSLDTIKGQGIEIPSEWKWGQLYGNQMKAGFRNTLTKSISGSTSNFLSQLSGLLVIWAGAILVLQGELTIGQLIAFRILSGYVTGPILRLTTLYQNFQETALSLERISDIIDNPQEIEIIGTNLPPMPSINGKIEFHNVNFRFSDNTKLILKNINFEISSGSFIGIVGESGSGKSTLLKLINQIVIPTKGIIKIDDFDIAKVNLYSLRSQIGVVPQDSILFRGTVQQNIALAKPEASFDEISNAAKLADANEFIQNLTSGYSTEVGERGSNLSGGQRQRIALARMFLQNPKLILLDEATSSLDINSEKRILKNLLKISDKKTVIFISHRLNNFIQADQIFYLYDGTIVEKGIHNELISLGGRYKALFEERGN